MKEETQETKQTDTLSLKRENGVRLALFTGTFDPFTIGHQNIAQRALKLFDKLVIAVAVSKLKHTQSEVESRVEDIRKVFANDDRIEVVAYSDLTINLAERMHATCIVRGVRNVRDFEWEREQADINRQLCGIETLLLFSEPQFGSISSTLVRELKYFGRDVQEFLPELASECADDSENQK